jgi:peroxiredoxin
MPDFNSPHVNVISIYCISSGFGERSWRYSVVINDMKVEKLFIEAGQVIQNSGPDPFEVSDAETMFKYLSSKK